MKKDQEDEIRNCNICSGDFSLSKEGGIDGYIGILRFALCPTCYAGIVDMVYQMEYLDEEEKNE